MTAFEKEKRKIKTAYPVYILCWMYIVVNSVITLTQDVPLYGSLTENIFALFVSSTMLISIYFLRTRKCIRCKNTITAKEIKNMGSFICPYCGNTDFTDRQI